MKATKKRMSKLERACVAVEQDIESSKRHWLEVKEMATNCLLILKDDPTARKWELAHQERDIVNANKALQFLDKGINVDIMTGDPL
jgi:hypothetical protein